MLCFFRKSILSESRQHITTISATSLRLTSVQNQNPWLSVKYISSTSNVQPFAASYLINTFGFSYQEAASVSKYLSFRTRENPDLVIEFFKKQGFSQVQILRIIRARPPFLQYDPEKRFLPKIEFFKSKGILCSDIPKIVTACPEILKRSLQKQIIPSFDFFLSLFQSKVKFSKALKRFSGFLLDSNTHAVPNIKLLKEEGVPEYHIVKLLEKKPRVLAKPHDWITEIVGGVKRMGFDPLKWRFVIAVATMACIGKGTWARKVDLYRRWGWSNADTLAAFGRYPSVMAVSENKIEAIMDFFVNEMGCKSSTIARYPVLLGLSLNNRIIPRASVFRVLLSKSLVKKLSFGLIFYTSERFFLEKFITRHRNEANELLKLYQEKMHVDG